MKLRRIAVVAAGITLATAIFLIASSDYRPLDVVRGKTEDHGQPIVSDSNNTVQGPYDSLDQGELREHIPLVDDETLDDFGFLQHKFRKSLNLDDHLADVMAHLLTLYDPERAKGLYEMYRAWLGCEMAVAESFQEITSVRSQGDVADILYAIHEFRKHFLGEEMAEQLYGAERKRSLYDLDRTSILNNPELYGREKEALMAELDDSYPEMAAEPDQNYETYQEKLWLYGRDLSEAGTREERDAMVQRIREETLPPETIQTFAAIDKNVRKRDVKDALYKDKKDTILLDKDLSASDKESQIDELRSDLFGPEGAKAQVRKENLEKGYQKIVAELKERGKG